MSAPESRTAFYERRLDQHLATLPSDDAKRAFLDGDLAVWQQRYRKFAHAEVEIRSNPKFGGPPSAFDYVETIAAISKRRAALDHGDKKDVA